MWRLLKFFWREAWGVAVAEMFFGERRGEWRLPKFFWGGVRLAIANTNTLRYGG